jgi:formylmethanofuran dehydrogenase subunit E
MELAMRKRVNGEFPREKTALEKRLEKARETNPKSVPIHLRAELSCDPDVINRMNIYSNGQTVFEKIITKEVYVCPRCGEYHCNNVLKWNKTGHICLKCRQEYGWPIPSKRTYKAPNGNLEGPMVDQPDWK